MTSLSVQAAQERILSHLHPVETEELGIRQCAGRVLASDILSSDLPAFDNSSVDGFAILSADLGEASPTSPRILKVIADIPAGSTVDIVLTAGTAARIMTGAPVPMGADAIVMIEDTDIGLRGAGTAAPGMIKVSKSIKVGENIRRRGSDVREGNKVLLGGNRLRSQDLGLLAMLGHARVSVFRKPRAALLSSGDELTPLDQPLLPGKIRDTNTYTLSSMISESGCETIPLGIAPDKREAIQQLLIEAIEQHADIIISSAGVSVGALDFIKEIIETEGNLDFWRVNIRPGKPLAVGDFHGIPFIGLPGNPVSAFIGFEIFVRPALGKLAGMKQRITRRRVRVTISEAIESDGRESYLRAIIEEKEDGWTAKLTGHQGSGNLLSLVEANALLIIPAGVKSLPIGAQADAWML